MNVVLKKINAYEKDFRRNGYNGRGKTDFITKAGKTKVMISASHAVNHFRKDAIKPADMFTGGIARYLQEVTGCHLIYRARYSETDPNYDEVDAADYKDTLEKYIRENDIKVLIDIHGCSAERETAVDMGTVDNSEISLGRYGFINDLLQIILNDKLSSFLKETGKVVATNKKFTASYSNTITNYISRETGIPCIQLEINRLCRDIQREEDMLCMVEALTEGIDFLSKVNWEATAIYAFRAKRSKSQFPQDKIEMVSKKDIVCGDILILRSSIGMEQAVLYKKCAEAMEEDCIYLTNRLIENLFGDENFEDKPILIHVCEKETFVIGRPAANVQDIAVSDSLYHKLKNQPYEYLLYNKYSRIKYHLPLLNYSDITQKQYGNEKETKVYIPYYYRVILDGELPLQEIHPDSFSELLQQIERAGDEESKAEGELLKENYKWYPAENIYRLTAEYGSDEEEKLRILQKKYIGSNALEVVKVPLDAQIEKKATLWERVVSLFLSVYIGGAKYDLKVCRPMMADDKNYVVRLSENMMHLLGVSENDRVDIRFGEKKVTLKALQAQQSENDMVIGLPANARKQLGLTDINDVVSVERNRKHIFLRNMSQQVFAILGSVLTVVTLFDCIALRWITGILLAPLTVWLVLSEERLRGKK